MIIGITGTIGAGKGTIAEYLVEKGFVHYSVRGYLTEEIEKRGEPVNRDSMVALANELREKNSPSFIVEELYRKAKEMGGNFIIESIRTPGEAEVLKNLGGHLIAVDADRFIRYMRIIVRGSATDKVTYEEFLGSEQRECGNTDPTKQNLTKCIEMADHVLLNEGSKAELYHSVEDLLTKL